MKCSKRSEGFISTLDRSICRSLNRDHTQAALGKGRHLLGEVGLNESF